MGLWSRLTGKLRNRGVLARLPDDADETEQVRRMRPQPTPTGRVPKRPEDTPSARLPEIEDGTAGTPSYGSPKGTPSTRRIHNPTHFR
jgi:hypothetical protein